MPAVMAMTSGPRREPDRNAGSSGGPRRPSPTGSRASSRGRHDRVVSAPDNGHVAVADRECLRAGIVVPDLDSEAPGRVDLEKVDLLEPDLVGRRLAVVLVGRIRRPVAGRVDRFAKQEPAGRVLGAEDRSDTAAPVPLAGFADPLVPGSDDACLRWRSLARRAVAMASCAGPLALSRRATPGGA